MKGCYVIPSKGAPALDLGHWVEIFEAYGRREEAETIEVASMRVGSMRLHFGVKKRRAGDCTALRPHEGKIVALEKEGKRIRFQLRLGSGE